jgi:hypothetical protein
MRYVYENGTVAYLNERNQCHRAEEEGPAMIWTDGYEHWYFHGKLHRIGGPAIVRPNGEHEYFLMGKPMSAVEHRKAKNLRQFS